MWTLDDLLDAHQADNYVEWFDGEEVDEVAEDDKV